ncbi:MAG: T9SS type A sorting domain-containing protein [Bacteroidota bacterium]
MKVLITIMLSLGFLPFAVAQSLGLQQIGAIGGDIQAGSGPQLSHSMGAAVYTIAEQSQVRLDQGMFVPCDLKCTEFSDGIADDLYNSPIIQIYPNPTSGILSIEGDLDLIDRYELFSPTGQRLAAGIISNQQLSISQLPAGIYFLQVYNKQAQLSFVGKVVKQ